MAHDCTRSCSGRTSSRCRRGSPSASLAVEVAGVLAAAAPLGMPSGKERTSPWLEAIAGIRERPYPRLGSKPVPVPGPVPRYGAVFGTDFHRRCPRLKQAPLRFRAPKKVGVNPFQARKCVRGNPVCGAIQCAGQSSVQARCAGQFFKLVVLSVGRSTLSYVVGSTVPVLAAERLHNERFNECQGR
jgi:hypothetical protein